MCFVVVHVSKAARIKKQSTWHMYICIMCSPNAFVHVRTDACLFGCLVHWVYMFIFRHNVEGRQMRVSATSAPMKSWRILVHYAWLENYEENSTHLWLMPTHCTQCTNPDLSHQTNFHQIDIRLLFKRNAFLQSSSTQLCCNWIYALILALMMGFIE